MIRLGLNLPSFHLFFLSVLCSCFLFVDLFHYLTIFHNSIYNHFLIFLMIVLGFMLYTFHLSSFTFKHQLFLRWKKLEYCVSFCWCYVLPPPGLLLRSFYFCVWPCDLLCLHRYCFTSYQRQYIVICRPNSVHGLFLYSLRAERSFYICDGLCQQQ